MAKTTKDFSLLHCWAVTHQKLQWTTHCSATEHPCLLHHRSVQAGLSFASRTSWLLCIFELGQVWYFLADNSSKQVLSRFAWLNMPYPIAQHKPHPAPPHRGRQRLHPGLELQNSALVLVAS